MTEFGSKTFRLRLNLLFSFFIHCRRFRRRWERCNAVIDFRNAGRTFLEKPEMPQKSFKHAQFRRSKTLTNLIADLFQYATSRKIPHMGATAAKQPNQLEITSSLLLSHKLKSDYILLSLPEHLYRLLGSKCFEKPGSLPSNRSLFVVDS